MAERPSVPHQLTSPRAATGPRASVATASPDASLAVDPALLAALDILQRNLKAEVNLALNGAVGAQRSIRETVLERSLSRWKGIAALVGSAAAVVAVAVGAAVGTYRQFTRDTAAAVQPVIEQTAGPIEQRVQVVEDRADALGQDVRALGRKVDRLGGDVSAIREMLEASEPQERRRTR